MSPIPLIEGNTRMRVRRCSRFHADSNELLDGRKGPRQQRRRGVAYVADAEREDEAVKFRLAPRVDRSEQLVEAFISTLLGRKHLLAGGPLAASRSRACASRRSNSTFRTSSRWSFSLKMSAAVFSRPALKNRSMFSAPSPSMSMAPRDTKWRRASTACAGQISSPVQRRRKSSLPVFSLTSRVAGEPQIGQVCGISYCCASVGRFSRERRRSAG